MINHRAVQILSCTVFSKQMSYVYHVVLGQAALSNVLLPPVNLFKIVQRDQTEGETENADERETERKEEVIKVKERNSGLKEKP